MNNPASSSPQDPSAPSSPPKLRLVQVPDDHYRPANYDELHRWTSYWYQIQSIVRTGARTVLEIGVGSGVLSSYLRSRLGIQVTTFDCDESRGPDLVGDVRYLEANVKPESFDAVVAFQVLEHLPFPDFELTLRQLARASRHSVLLSLPHYGWNLQWRIRLWKFDWAFSRRMSKNPEWTFNGEHHWEIGTRGFSLNHVRSVITRVLDIEEDYFCPDYAYHYFFECRKKSYAGKIL
jgi:hypothetical protein